MNAEVKPKKAETEIVPVKMEDGRIVDFAGKQKMKKEGYQEGDNLYVRFDFVNGEVVLYQIPTTLTQKFALHGASQKLGDAASDAKTVEDMVEAVSSTASRVKDADSWNVKREAGGFQGAHVIIRALMELKGRTKEEVVAWMERKIEETEGLTRQKLYTSLRATDQLKPIIARLEAETLSKAKEAGEDLLADA